MWSSKNVVQIQRAHEILNLNVTKLRMFPNQKPQRYFIRIWAKMASNKLETAEIDIELSDPIGDPKARDLGGWPRTVGSAET
jgi:hypothetical protein